MFKTVRNKKLEITVEDGVSILESEEHGVLSLGVQENGYGYGVPLNYAYDKDKNSIFFHCAMEGTKLDIIKNNNKVSFCVIGRTKIVPDNFTTYFESVMAFGKINVIDNLAEKEEALTMLVNKYSPDFKKQGAKYISSYSNITCILRLDIENITAKANRP